MNRYLSHRGYRGESPQGFSMFFPLDIYNLSSLKSFKHLNYMNLSSNSLLEILYKGSKYILPSCLPIDKESTVEYGRDGLFGYQEKAINLSFVYTGEMLNIISC
jgi:hypothetical protein